MDQLYEIEHKILLMSIVLQYCNSSHISHILIFSCKIKKIPISHSNVMYERLHQQKAHHQSLKEVTEV